MCHKVYVRRAARNGSVSNIFHILVVKSFEIAAGVYSLKFYGNWVPTYAIVLQAALLQRLHIRKAVRDGPAECTGAEVLGDEEQERCGNKHNVGEEEQEEEEE